MPGSSVATLHLPCSDPRFPLLRPLRTPSAGIFLIPPPNYRRGTKVPGLILTLATIGTSLRALLPQSASTSLLMEALQSYGLTAKQAALTVGKCPAICAIDFEATIKPKLALLNAAGFADADIAVIILSNPQLLCRGKSLIGSTIAFLSAILPSKDAVVRLLRNPNIYFTRNHEPNIETLRANGVPAPRIAKLFIWQPRTLASDKDKFSAAVESVKKLGISPVKASFMTALIVVSYMSLSTCLRKMAVYKELGWSEEEILKAFKLQPTMLTLSEENIRMKMVFYREMVGWGTAYLSAKPNLLSIKLKRIIPRCAVLDLLISKGLIPRDGTVTAWRLLSPDSYFFEHYVARHKNDAPEVVEAFEGKIEFRGWHWMKDHESR